MRPNIEVMCIVKFQYATSAMFLQCIFECFYLTCIAPFFLAKTRNKVAEYRQYNREL